MDLKMPFSEWLHGLYIGCSDEASKKNPSNASSPWDRHNANLNGANTDLDDSEAILAMEEQLANLQESDLAWNTKEVDGSNCEMYQESDHAACNLERELIGKNYVPS
ncbi:unnamed protein product [Strongylus vulgaris]|uniref:Uncharacterized protein n=1 Tax=Strongylus vulgaris TaxID=40348 RepID=A0A3P7ICA8_STRVU|nr:unnamed protein product [Strongylus vulgaris]